MNILDEIIAHKRIEIAEKKKAVSADTFQIHPKRPDVSFSASLRSRMPGLIAEVKRRSPSAGAIRTPMDPAGVARAYELAGARAVSVLIDEKYFGGGEADYLQVRNAVELPMLYKEFVIDEWQIRHAVSVGASAVLLIAAVLSVDELTRFRVLIEGLGMEALVEAHSEDEARMALDSGAALVGVNNRNLKTFVTDLETTFSVISDMPAHVTLISESGIKTAEDVKRLAEAGVHGLLVGESLLRQPDVEEAVKQLMGLAWASS